MYTSPAARTVHKKLFFHRLCLNIPYKTFQSLWNPFFPRIREPCVSDAPASITLHKRGQAEIEFVFKVLWQKTTCILRTELNQLYHSFWEWFYIFIQFYYIPCKSYNLLRRINLLFAYTELLPDGDAEYNERIFRGHHVHDDVSCTCAVASKVNGGRIISIQKNRRVWRWGMLILRGSLLIRGLERVQKSPTVKFYYQADKNFTKQHNPRSIFRFTLTRLLL